MNTLDITPDIEGKRLDKALSEKFPDYSRSYFLDLIKDEHVLVNDKIVKPSYILSQNDKVMINLVKKPALKEPVGQDIPLEIIFEDKNVIVINKQAGLVVHPASGNYDNTLVNALIEYFPAIKCAVYQKGNIVSETRPGIVHRLDKDTSGVIIVAKNKKAMHSLSKQIQNRTVIKKYLALCYGWPKQDSGTITSHLGRHPKNRKYIAEIGPEKGREAISDYKVVRYFQYDSVKISLLEFIIHTGRTHQIRVQSKEMGIPVLGDPFYGSKDSMKLSYLLKINRQLLHARELTLTLPSEKVSKTFSAPLPSDFQSVLELLTEVQT